MKADRIELAIDNKIIENLNSGESLIDVYYTLEEKIEKFSNREDFIDVSEKYLKLNWDSINFKKRYTTYYVIFSKKRKADIMWLIMNAETKFSKFGDFNDYKLFKLLKLKDKLKPVEDHVTS
jgi:hypothetical protein